MRSQWCREHIDETAEHCGIDESTVSEVKQAAQFCVDHSEYSDCSTMAILVLIRYPDMAVRDNAILSIKKSFDSGKHPLTGKITKSKILTAKDVKKILEKEEIALRGEVIKEIKESKKVEPVKESEPTKQDPDGFFDTSTPPTVPGTPVGGCQSLTDKMAGKPVPPITDARQPMEPKKDRYWYGETFYKSLTPGKQGIIDKWLKINKDKKILDALYVAIDELAKLNPKEG